MLLFDYIIICYATIQWWGCEWEMFHGNEPNTYELVINVCTQSSRRNKLPKNVKKNSTRNSYEAQPRPKTPLRDIQVCQPWLHIHTYILCCMSSSPWWIIIKAMTMNPWSISSNAHDGCWWWVGAGRWTVPFLFELGRRTGLQKMHLRLDEVACHPVHGGW